MRQGSSTRCLLLPREEEQPLADHFCLWVEGVVSSRRKVRSATWVLPSPLVHAPDRLVRRRMVCDHLRRALGPGFQRSQGLNLYGTTWGLLSRLRTAKDTPDGTKLSGNVEVDEVLIGEPRVKRLGARSSWRWPPNTALARHLWPPGPGHIWAFVLPNPLQVRLGPRSPTRSRGDARAPHPTYDVPNVLQLRRVQGEDP